MLIRLDSNIRVPSDDSRFLVDESLTGVWNDTEKQVEFNAEDLEDILNILNRLNRDPCAVIVGYNGWLRIVPQ